MRPGKRTGSAAALLGLAWLCAGIAPAATFRVSPVQLSLSASSTSGLLTLANESSETLRFQLNAFRWAEDERGQMQLAPTNDLLSSRHSSPSSPAMNARSASARRPRSRRA